MNRRIRIILGFVVLAISLTLLIWGFRPLGRVTRSQPIPPSELQLPTPISLLTQIEPVL